MPTGEVTRLLSACAEGDPSAADRLFPLVYDELRGLARGLMRHERRDHTLQATAIVHEAYLKLVQPTEHSFDGRAHFFRVAARCLRQVLVSHARSHDRLKRGGGRTLIELDDGTARDTTADPLDVLALDDALQALAALDERQAQVVEMRFFAGLGVEAVAEALGVSPRTAEADWAFARAWLRRRLGGGA